MEKFYLIMKTSRTTKTTHISNTKDSKNFMNSIRIYNNLFAFASFGAKLVTFPTAGLQVFRVCGQTCHNSYSLTH